MLDPAYKPFAASSSKPCSTNIRSWPIRVVCFYASFHAHTFSYIQAPFRRCLTTLAQFMLLRILPSRRPPCFQALLFVNSRPSPRFQLRNVTPRQGLRLHPPARTPCPSGVRLTANASQKQKDATETLTSVEGGPG